MIEPQHFPISPQAKTDIAPIPNILYSFTAVSDAEMSPGISNWAINIRELLSVAEWEKHQNVTRWIGTEPLQNLTGSEQIADFDAYLAFLSGQDPIELRDKIVYWMAQKPGTRLTYKVIPEIENPLSILDSSEKFLSFFQYPEMDDTYIKKVDEVFKLLQNPPELVAQITEYLRHFWDSYLAREWKKNLSKLQIAVERLSNVDLTGKGHFEVIETVTKRNMRGGLRPELLQNYRNILFIPSMHCGPYIRITADEQTLRIIFDANLLLQYDEDIQQLNTNKVMNRMKALADETRLEIIRALKTKGEMSTQEIIDNFNLSKSAASRHLRQLYANSIVEIRVAEDGLSKFYILNPAFVRDTNETLNKLLE
jgi:DNA-binding transcriptional ArsR family regulator